MPTTPERVALPVLDESCRSCGQSIDDGHDDECLLAEHQAMKAGDPDASMWHAEDDCYWCMADRPPTLSTCRCGDCCRELIIEVDIEDGRREPKIAERASPLFVPPELTRGRRELQGFLLNSCENGGACVFLDRSTNLCEIYDTRPLVCRLFNCDRRNSSDDEDADE